MAENVNHTYLEIARYLQNKMTPKEMHDFEKAMMEDPFLMDAVEGYSNAKPDVTQTHLAEIEAEISKEKTKNIVAPVAYAGQQWWKIAAIVIMIVGGSAIAYNWMTDTPTTSMATKQEVYKPLEADSFKPADEVIMQRETFKSPSPVAAAKSQSKPPIVSSPVENELMAMRQGAAVSIDSTIQPAVPGRDIAASTVVNEDLSRMPKQARSIAVESRKAPGSNYTIEGKVIDEKGEPVAFATVQVGKGGAITDTDGRFKLESTDSLVSVEVASVGYLAVKKLISPNNNSITLNSSHESLSEIVVTAHGTRKKSLVNASIVVLPKKGWKDYERYLQREIEALQDTSDNYESGTVELSFDVDTNGTPVNISITNSTAPFNNEFAMRILQKGPKWKQIDKLKKGVLLIRF